MSEINGKNGHKNPTDPTRRDAGQAEAALNIIISLNPVTKTISIQDNIHDPLLISGIIEQAKLILARRFAPDSEPRIQRPPLFIPKG